jgi:hypothetical protein
MTDLLAVPFRFPDVAGQRVLLLGLGGGCDILTAYALSRLLDVGKARALVYANTKTADDGHLEPITAHVGRVSDPPIDLAGRRGRTHGTTRIDRSVPRGDEGCPWVFLLSGQDVERTLPAEIRSLGFDRIIGVDTGGDSIVRKRHKGRPGRDQRMLRALSAADVALLHVVVAPGSDGESSYADLQAAMAGQAAEGRYRGCFLLEPILPVLRSLSGALSPTRTPRVILAAADGALAEGQNGRVVVPRGRRPAVPRGWLTRGFVLGPEGRQA